MNNEQFSSGLAFGLVVGICVTTIFFVSADGLEIQLAGSLTDWLAAMSAVLTVIVSFVAVLFVANTLKATRQTLDITQTMADDSRKIGTDQLRAWICVERVEFDQTDRRNSISLRLTNYGLSPARNIRSEVNVYNDIYPYSARAVEPITTDFEVGHIAPGGHVDCQVDPWDTVTAGGNLRTRVIASWSYKLINGDEVFEHETWVAETLHGQLAWRKSMLIDSANFIPKPKE